MESYSGLFGHFDRSGQINVRLNEDAIDAESPGFVTCDGVRNFIRRPPVHSRSTGVACLIRWVVRNLGLIEVGSTTISVPQHLKFLMMFDEQAVNGYVVPVNDESVIAGVTVPADAFLMVCPPDPRVIDNYIIAVDPKVDGG